MRRTSTLTVLSAMVCELPGEDADNGEERKGNLKGKVILVSHKQDAVCSVQFTFYSSLSILDQCHSVAGEIDSQ